MKYKNRAEAGHRLAEALMKYKSQKNALIVALPRGGLMVAVTLAEDLDLPLDFLFVERVTLPDYPDFTFAALTEKGQLALNKMEVKNINHDWLVDELAHLRELMKERRKLYLGNMESMHWKDKVIILVDDGIATGITMKAAVETVAKFNPLKIVVATPVASFDGSEEIMQHADEFVSVYTAYHFGSVGEYYNDYVYSDRTYDQIIKKTKHFSN